jgi:hypothetical protein
MSGRPRLVLVAVILGATLLASPQPVTLQASTPTAGTVLLRSDFDTWDDRWQIDGGKRTVWVVGGQLALGLEMTDAGWVRQARVDTEGTLDFRYGTFQARMRFEGIKGAHASFWAQSWSDYCDGCSEVDTVEHFGGGSIYQTLWFYPKQKRQTSTVLDPTAWHYYKVDWTPTGYTFYVDGAVRGSWTEGLSPRPHYLILSYLIADWERDILQRDRLGEYRAYVDMVELKANEWTQVL